MADLFANRPRATVDGKFFRRGAEKLFLKGVTYGPFAPNAAGEPFATPEQTARDFALAGELGANLLRIYHVPPRWFLELAAQQELLLLVDIPWDKHLVFLDDTARRAAARQAVCHAVLACAQHPAVFAYSVANEIPADIVRWSGAARVADFIDELVAEAKRLDPQCLCTFTNFPPTEFLRPQSLDFICFNVYLHQPQPFKAISPGCNCWRRPSHCCWGNLAWIPCAKAKPPNVKCSRGRLNSPFAPDWPEPWCSVSRTTGIGAASRLPTGKWG
ncbi:MAG: hypothetical protein U1F83_00075 [Verrucomicrobiota bacterium]